MKILAIGSEGNVGTELVKYLEKKKHNVFQCDHQPGWRPKYFQADINLPLDLMNVFDETKPEVVYHMAAMVSRSTCEASPSLTVSTNLVGLQNVIELCKKHKAKLIYFSTSEVYGNQHGNLDEEETLPMPNNRYGLTKYLGEKLIEYEVRQHGLTAQTVRPFMFYHEDETRGDHRSAMIRFIEHLSKDEPIEVHLGSERAWLHLNDGVRALEKLLFINDDYSVFNIGHNDFVKTEELAKIIANKLGKDLNKLAKYVELPKRMTLVKRPNLEKMNNILGIEPKVNIEEGIERVIKKFKSSS